MKHSAVTRHRARTLWAQGEKLEVIIATLGVPSSTLRGWLPRRHSAPQRWCPPQWHNYNKHLSWYWKIPLAKRQRIIAKLRPTTTKRERFAIMKEENV